MYATIPNHAKEAGLFHRFEDMIMSMVLNDKNHMRDCHEGEKCLCEMKIFALVFAANIAAVLCGFFGWYGTKSASLLSDAYHGLSDSMNNFGAIGVALMASVLVSRILVTRLRLVFGFVGIGLLLFGIIHVLAESVERFSHPRSISAMVAAFSIPSLILNLTAGALLERMADNLKTITSAIQHAHVKSDIVLSWLAVISGIAIAATTAISNILPLPKEYTGWIDMTLAIIACFLLCRIVFSGISALLGSVQSSSF